MIRSDILKAAAQVFSEKGYHGASMQDIAHKVNLKKASLYHHISSKQEILLALLDQALDLLIARVSHIPDDSRTPDEKLKVAICTYLQTLAEFRELASVLLLEYRSLESDFLNIHIPRRDRFERLWRDLIQQGVDEGIFNSVNPAMASRALLGVMNWMITWYKPEGPLSASEIADQYADLILFGLVKRDK